MFGEIEDLSHAGSFNDQQHSIGPTLFFNPGGANGDDDNGNEVGDHIKVSGPAKPEFSLNVGIQFSSDRPHLELGNKISRRTRVLKNKKSHLR